MNPGRAALAAALSAALTTALHALPLDTADAERYAALALACADREYPNKPEHVLEGPDTRSPQELHPAFFGCYDWHSSVHGHWLMTRLLRDASRSSASAARVREVLDAHFTEASVDAETRYLEQKSNRTFERPYGWAWTLRLAADLGAFDDPQSAAWRGRLRPLEDAIVARYVAYLPKLTHPIRTGVHPNTAFALAQGLDYARATGRKDFESVLLSRSHFYYGKDRACPAGATSPPARTSSRRVWPRPT